MNNNILHETGERWQLDALIPNRHRKLLWTQVEHSILKAATTPLPVLRSTAKGPLHYIPLCKVGESEVERQRRLRGGHMPLPGDRLL